MYDTIVVSETDIIGGKPIQVRPAVFKDRESAYEKSHQTLVSAIG